MKKGGIYFVFSMLVIYIIIFFFDRTLFLQSIKSFLFILKQVVPILLIVFLLLALSNYYLKEKMIRRWFSSVKGLMSWVIMIIGGFLSPGPPYLWYPLLADFQKKGMRNGFISCFIYNRAIKPYFLPMMIIYFGMLFTVVLTGVMIFFSVVQGLLMDRLVKPSYSDHYSKIEKETMQI